MNVDGNLTIAGNTTSTIFTSLNNATNANELVSLNQLINSSAALYNELTNLNIIIDQNLVNLNSTLTSLIYNTSSILQSQINLAEEPYDIAMYMPGNYTASEVISQLLIVRNIVIPFSFPGSTVYALIAPTNSVTLTISVNGSTIGNIVFVGGSHSGTFLQTINPNSPINISANSILTITTPSTIDPTLADISITIEANT